MKFIFSPQYSIQPRAGDTQIYFWGKTTSGNQNTQMRWSLRDLEAIVAQARFKEKREIYCQAQMAHFELRHNIQDAA